MILLKILEILEDEKNNRLIMRMKIENFFLGLILTFIIFLPSLKEPSPENIGNILTIGIVLGITKIIVYFVRKKKPDEIKDDFAYFTLSTIGMFFIAISFAVYNLPSILVGGVVGYFCARSNYIKAKEIKRKGILAYFIGLFFGLIGLVIYGIYYASYLEHKKKKRKK